MCSEIDNDVRHSNRIYNCKKKNPDNNNNNNLMIYC